MVMAEIQPYPDGAVFSSEDASALRPGGVAQRPPRLLLTLLGDYWWRRTESLPSAALVALLAEFGVSDSAARAALSRLTRNQLLVTSKSGRRTVVRLSARAAEILDEGGRHIFSFGRTVEPWDGMWSLVAFSIPEHNRAARDALRKQLRWLGFAPLYDGLSWHHHSHRVPCHHRPRHRPRRAAAAGMGPGQPPGQVPRFHYPYRTAARADPRRPGVSGGSARRPDPRHGRMARLPRPGPRPAE